MAVEPVMLGDRYELGDVIGRGGMAEVRRARDTRLGRDVAIKQLRVDLAGDPTFQARFKREAQSAAGLNHPNIVSVYDTGVRKDPSSDVEIPYIVMELVTGHTLRDILRDGRQILPERALELTAGVLDALSYSHKAGIIHRDIKPANVMLTQTGQVKVMDFGIARAVADTAATMTQTAAVIGTAQYLSPEQARGETVDHRSDIYSAGCLLYELLTGRPPFQGDSPVSVAYQHVRETPVAPSQVDDGDPLITPDMDAIVMKSLAKDPADRYQDAKAMKDDLVRVLAGQTATAVIPAAFALDATQAIPASQPTPVTTVLPASGPLSQPTPTAVLDSEVALAAQAASRTPGTAPAAVSTGATTAGKKETNPFVAAIITLVLALLLAGGAYAGYSWWDSQRKPEVVVQLIDVPDVTKQHQAVAEQILTTAGFVPKVTTARGPADTKGTVIAQDPAGRTQLEKGKPVTVTVNQGPETVTIPTGLIGKNVVAVTKQLTDLGLTVTREDASSEPPSAKAGDVTGLTPSEGQVVEKGGKITVLVATGQATVPNLFRKTEAQAMQKAESEGFRIEFREESYSAPDLQGRVFKQIPEGGETKASKSQPIIAFVSSGPAPSPTTVTETTTAPAPPPKTTAPPTSEAPTTPAAPPPPPQTTTSRSPSPTATSSIN